MLLGVINKKNEQIYIESKIKDNCIYISFDKIINDGIIHLNFNAAKDIINDLFNTNKTYLYSNSMYDIYIDSNSLKRFYKDGKEDFNMFYLANGVDATMYKSKKGKPLSKIFTFLLGGVTATVLITHYGINFITSYFDDTIKNLYYSVDIDSDQYEPVTLDKMQEYIFSSEGLSSFDKVTIYNEAYFKYLINTVDDSRLLYDYNMRLDGINISRYDSSVMPDSCGFYDSSKCNTINVLDTINEESDLKDVESHEFVHLTQCGRFAFIKEALAEIISHEFYNAPYTSYGEAIKRVKVLMEIIGPEPVFNAAYSYECDKFENSIKSLLSESEAEELLSLFSTYDYSEETTKDKCNRIDELLNTMLENKKKNSNYEMSEYDDFIIASIINDSSIDNRFYFNTYSEKYYNSLNVTTYVYDYEVDDSKNIEVCDTINISSIEYTKDNFINNSYDSKFIDFISNYEVLSLKKGNDKINYYKTNDGYIKETADFSDTTCYSLNEIISNNVYDNVTLLSSVSKYKYNDIKDYEFLENNDLFCLTATFSDDCKFTVCEEKPLRKINVIRSIVPSIYDKFGCANSIIDQYNELFDKHTK